jgi:glycerate 2-kinase
MAEAAIPGHALVAGCALGGLDAGEVVAAIARGLSAGGHPEPDACPLAAEADGKAASTRPARGAREGLGELLGAIDFDARMRAARAVIVAAPRLHERTLAGSATFEIATRARQAGVPTYAVTGENALGSFDARMLDLQLILEAHTKRALASAGRKLAGVI